MVEKVTRFINDNQTADKVYSHHGSLSKEIRSVVEKRFKEGELSGSYFSSLKEPDPDKVTSQPTTAHDASPSSQTDLLDIATAQPPPENTNQGPFDFIHKYPSSGFGVTQKIDPNQFSG